MSPDTLPSSTTAFDLRDVDRNPSVCALALFCLLARRAVVVDWECLPLCDAGMAEWYRRVAACYGDRHSTETLSYGAAKQFYRTIDDTRLTAIARTYGATHAVLHDSTETRLPVLWQSGAFKIVLLDATPAEQNPATERSAP